MNALALLQGRKTYLTVGVAIAAIVIEKGLGFDVPFFTIGPDWALRVTELLGIGFLRAGVKTR